MRSSFPHSQSACATDTWILLELDEGYLHSASKNPFHYPSSIQGAPDPCNSITLSLWHRQSVPPDTSSHQVIRPSAELSTFCKDANQNLLDAGRNLTAQVKPHSVVFTEGTLSSARTRHKRLT